MDRAGVDRTKPQILSASSNASADDSTSDVKARVYDTVAFVTGTRHSAAENADIRFLHTYVWENSRWKAFAFQENTVLPPPPQSPSPPPMGPVVPTPCENPCQSIPSVPHSKSERDVIGSYLRLETASAGENLDEYARYLADELVIINTYYNGNESNKIAAFAAHQRQKESEGVVLNLGMAYSLPKFQAGSYDYSNVALCSAIPACAPRIILVNNRQTVDLNGLQRTNSSAWQFSGGLDINQPLTGDWN